MKKSLLFIGLAVVLFSCKKIPTAPTLASNSLTGTAQFTGTVTIPQVYVTGGGGLGSIPNIPVKGVTVTVAIPNQDLYPLSQGVTIGSTIFSGVTDVNGNYNISVTTTTQGIDAWVNVSGVTATYDQVAGTQAYFSGSAQRLWFKAGAPTIQNWLLNYSQTQGTNVTGIATISGILSVQYYQEIAPGTKVGGAPASFPLANQTVYLNFNADPTTGLIKTYTTTTNAKGGYTFAVTTSNGGGYADEGNIYVYNYSHTADTLTNTGTAITGVAGYYPGLSINSIANITPNAIITEENMTFYMSSFLQN